MSLQISMEGQKRGRILELELQIVITCLSWVLGIKPGSLVRAASAVNHKTTLPAPVFFLLPKLLDTQVDIERDSSLAWY